MARREKPSDRDMMTIGEIADKLDASTMTVYRLVHQGALPAIRISKRSLRVRRRDFEKYLNEHKIEGEG